MSPQAKQEKWSKLHKQLLPIGFHLMGAPARVLQWWQWLVLRQWLVQVSGRMNTGWTHIFSPVSLHQLTSCKCMGCHMRVRISNLFRKKKSRFLYNTRFKSWQISPSTTLWNRSNTYWQAKNLYLKPEILSAPQPMISSAPFPVQHFPENYLLLFLRWPDPGAPGGNNK